MTKGKCRRGFKRRLNRLVRKLKKILNRPRYKDVELNHISIIIEQDRGCPINRGRFIMPLSPQHIQNDL